MNQTQKEQQAEYLAYALIEGEFFLDKPYGQWFCEERGNLAGLFRYFGKEVCALACDFLMEAEHPGFGPAERQDLIRCRAWGGLPGGEIEDCLQKSLVDLVNDYEGEAENYQGWEHYNTMRTSILRRIE